MKFIKHSGSRAWQQVIKQKWWLNQQRAINCAENYFASNSDRQPIVRMPTGTGKTAVIATVPTENPIRR
jgi:type I site-specific restriction endonuclease